MASAAIRSKAVVLPIFFHCLLLFPCLWVFCVLSLYFCADLCGLSSFAIISLGKKAVCLTFIVLLLLVFTSFSRYCGLIWGVLLIQVVLTLSFAKYMAQSKEGTGQMSCGLDPYVKSRMSHHVVFVKHSSPPKQLCVATLKNFSNAKFT